MDWIYLLVIIVPSGMLVFLAIFYIWDSITPYEPYKHEGHCMFRPDNNTLIVYLLNDCKHINLGSNNEWHLNTTKDTYLLYRK
jgi:hypothetical protein